MWKGEIVKELKSRNYQFRIEGSCREREHVDRRSRQFLSVQAVAPSHR